VVERSQLGRNQQALSIVNQEVACVTIRVGTRVLPRPGQFVEDGADKFVRAVFAIAFKELPNLPSPILPHNQIRAQVPAPRNNFNRAPVTRANFLTD
jgi:hypothetical protein